MCWLLVGQFNRCIQGRKMADTKGWYACCLLHRLISIILALMLLFGTSAGRTRGVCKCWLGAGEGSANQNVCFGPETPGVDLPTRLNQQQDPTY
jgi:hypothetical protein